jgi:hypothetical protein
MICLVTYDLINEVSVIKLHVIGVTRCKMDLTNIVDNQYSLSRAAKNAELTISLLSQLC